MSNWNKGAKPGGKVAAPNKLWHAFKHKNLDVFKREYLGKVFRQRHTCFRGGAGSGFSHPFGAVFASHRFPALHSVLAHSVRVVYCTEYQMQACVELVKSRWSFLLFHFPRVFSYSSRCWCICVSCFAVDLDAEEDQNYVSASERFLELLTQVK